MTDMTIIKIATPNIIPINENVEMTFKKPSFFFGLKFLSAINFSTELNNLLS